MIKRSLLWIILIIFTVIIIPFFIANKIPRYQNLNSGTVVKVFFEDKNEVKTMLLDDYIVGVVCAEMPASFETEALKAQAVATRSYTISKMHSNKNSAQNTHKDADICTSSKHCQAYIVKDEAYKKWNEDAKKYYKKIKNAVYETSGEIITYNGNVINAVFHASNGGKTENSKDVWGGDVPYLKSVESFGEEYAKNYKTTISFNIDEFKNILSGKYPDIIFNNLIGEKTITDGNSVKEITIGNKKFKGTEIRQMFNLNSANFDIKINKNDVLFNVTGHGHGVGMSQYGANAMAKDGKLYKEILRNYYTDTEISTYIKP